MHCLFVLGEALAAQLLKPDRMEQTAWLLLSLPFRASTFEAQPTEKNIFSQETEETTVCSRQVGFSPGKRDVINISVLN